MISHNHDILTRYCDSVVMLTWSNWKTEPRSNRYHYASRFSKHLPVIFVQPDLSEREAKFEETEVDNVVILHVYAQYGYEQTVLLNEALLERGLTRPLLWVYNVYFYDFIAQRYSPLMVYHATEDYFSPDASTSHELHPLLRQILKCTDLLVAVSQEVLLSYKKNGQYNGKTLLLENGCDFPFWAPDQNELEQLTTAKPSQKIAFYQGGINARLDLKMLTGICKALTDWEIWLCGAMAPGFDREKINPEDLPNLKSLGFLSIQKVRELAYQATVGIIPFVQNDVIRVSLPLKAFEYVACGLPVVSVPIPALKRYSNCFIFADNLEDFIQGIIRAGETRHDREWVEGRLKVAREQDYDIRFSTLLDEIDFTIRSKERIDVQFNILVLYDANSLHVSTIKEHLESFSKYSKSKVFYASATHGAICTIDLSRFDVVIIHYSVRLSSLDHLSSSYAEAIRGFGGYKVLFIQDEYDTPETARCWIESLGIHAVFTCVPEEYVDQVYPKSRFPYLERVHTLTGFVPIGIEKQNPKPIPERQITIGYRGRPLPFYYGDLGREKVAIAQRMKQICQERNIPEDIEWSHEKRIYGDQWYPFVESSKATLGTESGSNVFDDYGEIKRNVEKALALKPPLSYEQIHARYVSAHEGKILMNQISPRIFEAIALRTALVLFEGKYSGIIQPDIHYIPLKKDFSNIEEVLAKLADDSYLMVLTERAYKDIILSNKYSYEKFIGTFDAFLSNGLAKRNNSSPLTGLVGVYRQQKERTRVAALSQYPMAFSTPLSDTEISMLLNSDLPLHFRDILDITKLWIQQKLPITSRRVKKYYLLVKRLLQKYFRGIQVN